MPKFSGLRRHRVTRFKIVVPAYNCERWLERCLDSIAAQTYREFDVCVIDDASTDINQRTIIETACRRHGWMFHFNDTNRGALANIVHGIQLLAPRDEDVIVTVDGDDWLYHEHALERLDDVYRSGDVYLTYGQFMVYPRGNVGFCRPIDARIIERGMLRQVRFRISHLRTFKYLLWRHIRDQDLRDGSGDYFRVAWDLAFMYPMMEMAGFHFRFVDDILYVYNKANPLSDKKLRRHEQLANEQLIRSKPPYAALIPGPSPKLSTATAATPFKYLGLTLWWHLRRVLRLAW